MDFWITLYIDPIQTHYLVHVRASLFQIRVDNLMATCTCIWRPLWRASSFIFLCCHPKKTEANRGWHWFSKFDSRRIWSKDALVFEGWPFPMLPSRAVNIYYTIMNVNQVRLVSKQSRSSEYLCLYFILRIFKRSYEASQNFWRTVRA